MCPTPLWRGNCDLTVVGWFCLSICMIWTFRSWLILVQVPPCTWDLKKFFTPPPLTFISFMIFFHHTYFHHISFSDIHACTKESPSILPTRIDSCPPFQYFRYGGSFDFHTQLSQWNLFPSRFTIWSNTTSFRVAILEKNPVTVRRLQHFGRRPRAKNPTRILVREKKSALLACLWLSNRFTTHVAIVSNVLHKSTSILPKLYGPMLSVQATKN